MGTGKCNDGRIMFCKEISKGAKLFVNHPNFYNEYPLWYYFGTKILECKTIWMKMEEEWLL